MAGFREVLAVEWDDHAVECFKLNFPEVPVYHGDIAALSVEECLALSGFERGQLDVFDGSPPCQGFSTAGKRQIDDPRNSLFREFVRLLDGLQPRVFVMENVSGMVKGKMKLVFAEVLRALKRCGYLVSARLLDAANYGVPQHRQRIIFVGVREDLGVEPSHPQGSARLVPVSAISVVSGGKGEQATPTLDDAYGKLWAMVPIGGCAYDVIGKGYNSCVKVRPDRPCNTLPKLQTGKGFASLVHWDESRALSLGEAKRIGAFPDQFHITGEYSKAWARIGNSVPPLFMRAIARHIRSEILGQEVT